MGFDELLAAAQTLPPDEQRRLAEALSRGARTGRRLSKPRRRRSLFGVLRDRGRAPSEADIAEARREAWLSFPRDDAP